MSYAIGNIIYGIRLTPEARQLIEVWEADEESPWYEDKHGTCGFEMPYTAHGPSVGWCGVQLGSIDEGSDVRIATLPKQPDDEQIAAAQVKIAKLHPDLRALCGGPDVWIVWSSS